MKSEIAKTSLRVVVFILSSAFCPFGAGQQSQPQVGSIDPSQFAKAQSIDDTLNDEAKAGDSAGIHRYSEHLIHLLVPDRAGQKYVRSLTDRLAKAEGLARTGKGSLVPEAKITQAYNDLMKQLGAPTSLLADEMSVRNLRLIQFDKPSDALITSRRNGTNCNPGEAMFLLLVLIWNNGGPRLHLENVPGNAQPSGSTSGGWFSGGAILRSERSAGRLLESYSAAHNPHDTATLFNAVAKTLGF